MNNNIVDVFDRRRYRFDPSSSWSSRVGHPVPQFRSSAYRELTARGIIVMVISSWALWPSILSSAEKDLMGRVVIVMVILS
mmetsp:Transcript_17349/g.47090  ORF Transcript_17349/g.47090 Transcript_17349/m.47090 type:complete len:81 (+) Transcript_17349:416-658(+)